MEKKGGTYSKKRSALCGMMLQMSIGTQRDDRETMVHHSPPVLPYPKAEVYQLKVRYVRRIEGKKAVRDWRMRAWRGRKGKSVTSSRLGTEY